MTEEQKERAYLKHLIEQVNRTIVGVYEAIQLKKRRLTK